MYALKKPAPTTYTPPGQRKADPLAPENFPAFGAAAPTPKQPSLNFLQRVKETEEERAAAAAAAAAIDPNKLATMPHARLRAKGWEVYDLRLVGSTEWLQNWHRNVCGAEEEFHLPAGSHLLPAREPDDDAVHLTDDDLSSVCSEDGPDAPVVPAPEPLFERV